MPTENSAKKEDFHLFDSLVQQSNMEQSPQFKDVSALNRFNVCLQIAIETTLDEKLRELLANIKFDANRQYHAEAK